MIDEMPAGLELDQLVSKEIMEYPAYGGIQQWKPFSTDLNAALEAVEHLLFFQLTHHQGELWEATCLTSVASAPTAPLAICRALLKPTGK